MYRIAMAALGSLLAASAFAGQPAPNATPVTASAQAAADKVYPPLPSLAMLPPPADDEDDAPPKPAATSKKKKVRVQDCHCAMPMPRLVVSDASRTYLKGIDRQLDLALAH